MSDNFNFKIEDLVNAKAIAADLQKEITAKISNSICWQAEEMVKKEVLELLKPEIASIVADARNEILNGIRDGLPAVAKLLAEKMLVDATKNLNGYNGTEIMRKIFG